MNLKKMTSRSIATLGVAAMAAGITAPAASAARHDTTFDLYKGSASSSEKASAHTIYAVYIDLATQKKNIRVNVHAQQYADGKWQNIGYFPVDTNAPTKGFYFWTADTKNKPTAIRFAVTPTIGHIINTGPRYVGSYIRVA